MFNAPYKPEATLLRGAPFCNPTFSGPGGAVNSRAFPHPARRIDLLLIGGQGSTVSGLRQLLICFASSKMLSRPLLLLSIHAHALVNAFAVLSVRLGEGAKRTVCVESIILNQEVCPYELEN